MTVAEEQMAMFLQKMVRLMVTRPDDARVHSAHVEDCLVMTVTVAKHDVGRVIGRRGSVANSIRSVMQAISGQVGVRFQLNLPHSGERE